MDEDIKDNYLYEYLEIINWKYFLENKDFFENEYKGVRDVKETQCRQ